MRAERLYGLLHILYGSILLLIPNLNFLQKNIAFFADMPEYDVLYWVVFASMICYMPTISLSNSVSYRILNMFKGNVVKDFPSIRVWGTIGFIAAMWTTNLSGSKDNSMQFVIAGITAILLGIYAFTLPACRPEEKSGEKKSLGSMLGLDAFRLFANYKMALFFVFSMLLGAALQLSNMYGDAFLSSFKPGSIVEKYSMGSAFIVLSCIVYGMAFDFFLISGSMYIETTTDSRLRSSAQGLFIMMTNGFGAYFGTIASSWIIDQYFTFNDGTTNWHFTWMTFAMYCLIVAILFAVLFKHEHRPEEIGEASH
jgi:NHS family xanthosine MFS transporter